MISESFNFLFIHVPKTGGNSIQKVLVPFSDDHITWGDPNSKERFGIKSSVLDIEKHSTLEHYRSQLDPERFAQYFKFTCVRNPWDRCVSYFFSPHRGIVEWSPDSFAEFIQSTIDPHRHYLALEPEDTDPFATLDMVLSYENLKNDFSALCDRIGIGDHALPHINASKRNHYRFYYDDHAKELVADKFAEEISRFGYKF
jgi:hypothetical protein